jgi:RNA polymerase sigma-70 factor (ECF subfamily)
VDDIVLAEGFEEAASARLDVDNLLSTLSSKQARAIRDTHIEGKSVAEAAIGAGIGESDVKISVHRGLKAIANRIRGA